MGFVSDIFGGFFGDGDIMDIIAGGKADVADLWGMQGEDEAREASIESQSEMEQALDAAMMETRRSRDEGQSFLQPYGDVGLQGVENAGFLTDPQAQFDYLQNNPLFQLALDNANRTTQASSAARGRLSAGDTLAQLSNNVLLSAQPLINDQKNSIQNLLNFGGGIGTAQANTAIGEGTALSGLMQAQGNTAAAGTINRNQIAQDARGQQQQTAMTIASMFSDSRLKEKAKIINNKNGYDIWSWEWNEKAKKLFNLSGKATGVMFNEVLKKDPNAVSYQDGYGKVNYSMIGV